DFDIGGPARIVDADVDEFPADPAGPVAPIAGDPVADPGNAAQLLDVDVHELARVCALVAPHRFGRRRRPQPAECLAPQDPPARGAGDGHFAANGGAAPAPRPP